MSKLKFLLLFVVLSVFISKIAAQNNQLNEILAKRDSVVQSQIGKPLLDFLATSEENGSISNKDLIGKVTIINFWFSTCSPCIAEFGELNELYIKHKNNTDFQFISLTFEPFSIINDIISKYEIPYNIYMMSPEDCNRLNLKMAYPVTIILNKKGEVFSFKSGGHTDKEKVMQQVKQYDLQISELLKN